MFYFSHVLKPIKGQDLLENGKSGCNAFPTGVGIQFGGESVLGWGHFNPHGKLP